MGLIFTSLLASCKKNNNTTSDTIIDLNLDGISFTATTEGHDRNAKTYLDGEDIKWMAGDLILVQNSASPVQRAPFEVVYGLKTMNGTFYTGSTFDRSPAYDAAYPYSMATLDGTTATFNLPQQQQMTETGTFGNGAMPMVAHSTNNVLNFYNVCGGVCFPLQGAGKHVTKIVLTSKDTNDKLWGTFTASCTAVPTAGNVTSGPMPTHISGGSNIVELICNGSTGITLTDEPQDFYIMVPPQTMKTGFTMTAYDGANVIYNRDINWDAVTHTNFITRSVVSRVQTAITISDPLTVTTVSPTFISTTQAYGQGTVASDVADNITERGMCWAKASETTTPTIANSYKAEGGTATGAFALMFGDTNPMIKDCVYYVRAYAKNASGVTFYGDPIPFATRDVYADGKSKKTFSLSASQAVYFSMGNLLYQASSGTWKFADYQFEYVGGPSVGLVYANGMHPDASLNGAKSDNSQIGSSYNGWIDLFGWGTSGYHYANDIYNTRYRPYDYSGSTVNESYNLYGYGPSNNQVCRDLIGTTGNMGYYYDWGNNKITNGGNANGRWRTPTGGGQEWYYLLHQRSASTVNTTANARWALAALNVRDNRIVHGLMIFPNTFAWPNLVNVYPSVINAAANYPNGHVWTEAEWSLLEHEGVIFLPCSGHRIDASCIEITEAYYWSASKAADNILTTMSWGIGWGLTGADRHGYLREGTVHRYRGCAVRLVYK